MSADDLTIRPAIPQDFPAIASLLNGAYGIVSVNVAESAATVRERAEDALVVVVEARGAIIATLTAAPAGSYYGRLARPGQMEVSRLAVAPTSHGRGIGRTMLRTFAESCKGQGVQALVGATLESMTAAHHLYESIGAKRGTIPGAKARGYVLDLTDNHNEKDSK